MTNPNNERKELERQAELERKYEFAKFKVKTTMTLDEIKMAVKERDFEDARDNSDFLWDLVCDWHDNRKMSDDDYITEYVDYISDWENDDGTNE